MKKLIKHSILIVLFSLSIHSCMNKKQKNVQHEVSFETTFNFISISKDGCANLETYVVNLENIDKTFLKKIEGRTIKISGVVTVHKGVHNFDKNGKLIKMNLKQGRENDYKYIENPKIEIVR